MTSLKINRLLSVHTSYALLKFGIGIESQFKVGVRKPKLASWPSGGHIESDITENHRAYAHSQKRHVYEVLNVDSKANPSYSPETVPPIKSRKRTIQYGQEAAILKMTSLKIDRYQPKYTSATKVWSRYANSS